MNWHLVINKQSGEAFSIGTVLADPMPDHLEPIALTDEQASGLLNGTLRWDGATRSFSVIVPENL